jgi:DNA-binding CsgD family transcriptional regulator
MGGSPGIGFAQETLARADARIPRSGYGVGLSPTPRDPLRSLARERGWTESEGDSVGESDTLWSAAAAVARTPAPPREWRSRLARAVREAAGAAYASVVTCPPGEMFRVQSDCDPPALHEVVERIESELMPRIDHAGESWEYALALHGRVYTPLEASHTPQLAQHFRDRVLTPFGLHGWVVAYLVDSQRRVLGCLTVGDPAPSIALHARVHRPIVAVCEAAERTLENAMALATACGAHPPRTFVLKGLTPRERQVAVLVADGFSDVNIAARLGISEQTVGVHLRRIYSKLGIHSRLQLASSSSAA